MINSTKTVDYMIKKKGDSFIVVNKGEMKIPVEIAFYNKDDELIES